MSRYRAESMEPILSAAEHWRDKCLIGGGSVFFDENLWTIENVKDLYQHFVENPHEGKRGFYSKLEKQLGPCPSSAKKLCAEIIWLLYLSPDNKKPGGKRKSISDVLSWANEEISDEHSYYQDEVLSGLGSGGVGFFTEFWRELRYAINLLKQHYTESQQERLQKLSSGEEFSAWLESIPENNRRQFRHMILFLLFPDTHERIFGGGDRRRIAEAFSGQPRAQIKKLTPRTLDGLLYKIRKELEQKYKTDKLDWYDPPLASVWRDTSKPNGKKVEEPVTAFNQADAFKDVFIPQDEIDNMLVLLRSKKNIILKGPPGVGKTFIAKKLARALMKSNDESRIGMVQFHQSYSYEDFVQGYRPRDDGGFELRDGKFHQFCTQAQSDPTRKYVFIIDEINRGNLSKILGELMVLIEADKRGDSWAIPLTYSQEKFSVPANLYLIGLMNTADRSLALVDYALRRRFTFFDLKPEFNEAFRKFMQDAGADQATTSRIMLRLPELNQKIASDTANLGPGFCIGHSFFCPQDANRTYDDRWFERIIRFEIKPLLEEYWFDDPKTAEKWVNTLLSKTS